MAVKRTPLPYATSGNIPKPLLTLPQASLVFADPVMIVGQYMSMDWQQ